MELRNAAPNAAAETDRLAAIEARLERIERLLTPLAQVVEAAPGGVAAVTDMLDDWAQRDGQVDRRMRNLGDLLTQVTEPETVQTLTQAVKQAKGLEGALATVTDMFDDWAGQDGRIDQRLNGLTRLLTQVTEPATLEQLSSAVKQAQGLSGMMAAITDMIDDWAQRDGRVDQRMHGLTKLLTQVTEPGTLAHLSSAVQQAEGLTGMVAAVTDMMDDWARRDGRVDQRMHGLTKLLTQATDPATLQQLSAAMRQVQQMAGMLAMATDIIDDWARKDGQVDRRLHGLMGVLKQASEPGMLEMLSKVLKQSDAAPGLIAMAVDIADELAAEASRNGIGVEELVVTLRRAVGGMSRLATSPEVKALFESGMLAPDTLRTLGSVSSAVSRASHASRPIGLLGALRASRQDAFQRTVGFAVAVATEFGRAIQNEEQPKRLEEGHV